MTVNPLIITNFSRSDAQLEEFLLFAIAVAGKNAQTTSRRLDAFLWQAGQNNRDLTPFEKIDAIGWPYDSVVQPEHRIVRALKNAGIGQYNRIGKAYAYVVSRWSGRDLRTITAAELERVPGIGPKTSRFFLLHSRPNQRVAVLDVHILRRLRSMGYTVPAVTPSNKLRYRQIEETFLTIADKLDMSPADLDLLWWKEGALSR